MRKRRQIPKNKEGDNKAKDKDSTFRVGSKGAEYLDTMSRQMTQEQYKSAEPQKVEEDKERDIRFNTNFKGAYDFHQMSQRRAKTQTQSKDYDAKVEKGKDGTGMFDQMFTNSYTSVDPLSSSNPYNPTHAYLQGLSDDKPDNEEEEYDLEDDYISLESPLNNDILMNKKQINILELLKDFNNVNKQLLLLLAVHGYTKIILFKFIHALLKKRSNEASFYLLGLVFLRATGSSSFKSVLRNAEQRRPSQFGNLKNKLPKCETLYSNEEVFANLTNILRDFSITATIDWIYSEILSIIPNQIKSTQNISKIEEEYDIDLTSLYTLNHDILLTLTIKGLFSYLKYTYSDINYEVQIWTQSTLKLLYYKTKEIGFKVDPMMYPLLVLHPVDYDTLGISLSLYIDINDSTVKIAHIKLQNKSQISKEGNILPSKNSGIKEIWDYLAIPTKKSESDTESYININNHKVSKNLFEEATECDLYELLANLEFEESL